MSKRAVKWEKFLDVECVDVDSPLLDVGNVDDLPEEFVNEIIDYLLAEVDYDEWEKIVYHVAKKVSKGDVRVLRENWENFADKLILTLWKGWRGRYGNVRITINESSVDTTIPVVEIDMLYTVYAHEYEVGVVGVKLLKVCLR